MIEDIESLLLCTNGDQHTRPGIKYGIWLSTILRKPVKLLGIIETKSEKDAVIELTNKIKEELLKTGVPFDVCLEQGRAPQVIGEFTCNRRYLTIVGPLGRPAWQRAIQGRSFRRIIGRVASPLIYVPQARIPIKRILICLGGLAYGFQLEIFSLYLAKATGASVELFHVVEPINLDYPISREIQRHWQNILETETPQGENLRKAMQVAINTDLQVDFKVRHGNIVHEILEEVRNGDFDLVSLGSAFSTHSLRHLYLPNVTAEVAEALQCPVLSVRQSGE
jgi:nucleotide-binding universal stress UspA family protein